jgi:hypothetical protein
MSHKLSFFQKAHLYGSAVFWIVVTLIAGIWLTVFLIGTLGGSFGKEMPKPARPDVFKNVVALTEKKVERYLGEWEFSEPKIPGHFHHIGRWYETDKRDFCLTCHGPSPHSRTPKERAFLNMHSLYIACNTCHVREQAVVAPSQFGWKDITTGTLCANPTMVKGVWGEYGAKIVPLSAMTDHMPVRLDEEEAFTKEFRKKMDKLDDRQKMIGNKFIHKRCVETPVHCTDCHNAQKTFLPYTALGYSQERTTFLMGTEVADLAKHYETFYLPKMLNTERQPHNTAVKDDPNKKADPNK